jgi:hypothetical protein
MSDGFNWDSEIPTEEELEKRAVRAPAPESRKVEKMEKTPEPVYIQEQAIEESLDEYEFLTNARLRLEQGRLYEMFLKHNLFGDIDSDPRAVANVQKELKEFIQERLEVLLGLKPDPKLRKVQMEHSMPFNSLEIDILKKVIGRISGGATEQAEAPRPTPKSDVLKPLSTSKPVQSINPIGEQPKQPMSIRKTTPAPSSAPSEQPVLERPNKPISELTPSERAEWNKQISLEQKAKKAPPTKNHTPMPSYDQQVMHYGSQTNRYAQNALVGKILQSLPNKGE